MKRLDITFWVEEKVQHYFVLKLRVFDVEKLVDSIL